MKQKIWEGNKKKHTSSNLLLKSILKKFDKDLLETIKISNPKKVLDIGCGEGFYTKIIADALPSAEIVGIDVEEEYIAFAKRINFQKNVKYSVNDLFKLPFKKEEFDLVICTEVLEHLEKYDKALEIIRNLSKKFFIVSVPNEPWFRIANLLRFKYVKRLGNTPGHVNNWSKKQIKRIVSNYGKIIRFKTSSFWNIILLKKIISHK